MENSSSFKSIVKRVNLLIVIFLLIVSCVAGIVSTREIHSDAVFNAELLAKKEDEKNWVDVKSFDPDKYLAEKDKEQKSSDVPAHSAPEASWVIPILLGIGACLVIFISGLLLMMTISWIFGFKFKLHLSAK